MTPDRDPPGLDVAIRLGIDVRAPTRPMQAVSWPVEETTQPGIHPELTMPLAPDEVPEPSSPWPDRRVWPATRRLFALWRFEREGQHEHAETTRRALTERGVLP